MDFIHWTLIPFTTSFLTGRSATAAGSQNTSRRHREVTEWGLSFDTSALQTTDLMCSRDGLTGNQLSDHDVLYWSVVIRRKRYLRIAGEPVVTRTGRACARLSTSLHTIITDSCHIGRWTCPSHSPRQYPTPSEGHKLQSGLISTRTYMLLESIFSSMPGTVATSSTSLLPTPMEQ